MARAGELLRIVHPAVSVSWTRSSLALGDVAAESYCLLIKCVETACSHHLRDGMVFELGSHGQIQVHLVALAVLSTIRGKLVRGKRILYQFQVIVVREERSSAICLLLQSRVSIVYERWALLLWDSEDLMAPEVIALIV